MVFYHILQFFEFELFLYYYYQSNFDNLDHSVEKMVKSLSSGSKKTLYGERNFLLLQRKLKEI